MDSGINLIILIAGSFGMCAGAYALNRSRRKQPAAAEPARSSQSAPDELELLRYENAMLRAEQHRSLSLGKAGERIREGLGDVTLGVAAPGITPVTPGVTPGVTEPTPGVKAEPTSGTDDGDDAWTALTEATVLRDTMLAVCRDLQSAVSNVELQLSSGVPITELDRRRTDRGSQSPSAPSVGAHAAHTDHPDHTITLPGHTRLDLPVAQETGR